MKCGEILLVGGCTMINTAIALDTIKKLVKTYQADKYYTLSDHFYLVGIVNGARLALITATESVDIELQELLHEVNQMELRECK